MKRSGDPVADGLVVLFYPPSALVIADFGTSWPPDAAIGVEIEGRSVAWLVYQNVTDRSGVQGTVLMLAFIGDSMRFRVGGWAGWRPATPDELKAWAGWRAQRSGIVLPGLVGLPPGGGGGTRPVQ